MWNKGCIQLIHCQKSESTRYVDWNSTNIMGLCKIYWLRNRAGFDWRLPKKYNAYWNHIVNEFVLTKKHHLAKNVQDYMTINEFDDIFHPLTFNLDEEDEREIFYSKLMSNETLEKNNKMKWIIKPVDASGGKGIKVVDNMESFKDDYEIRSPGDQSPQLVRSLIAQTYISEPLLLGGYKFDIRSYMFIASISPPIVFFHDGYLRVNIEKYDNDNLDNLWAHISNIGLQKKHPEYEQKKLTSKWTLKTWLNFMIKEKMIESTDFYATKIRPQFLEIIKKSYLSVADKFDKVADVSSFALLGVDFLLDTSYKAWLLEYTKTPAGHSTLEQDDTLFSDMMGEVLDIILEIDEKRKKSLPLDNIESAKDFFRVI